MNGQLSLAAVILISAVISMVVTIPACAARVENGDFESAREGQPVGWEAVGPGVAVKPFASVVWSRGERIFNSAEYEVIRVYLGIQGGAGTVWFDNVGIEESSFSKLTIVNRSFEEGDANTLTGWGQDAPGERTFRDTTVWTRFPGQGFGSGASARVTSPDGNVTRIWQDISVGGRGKPNTDYVLSFSWQAEDLDGDVYAQVYGIEPNGELGRAFPMTVLPPTFPPEQFGKNLAELSLSAPGETGLSQRVALSPAERERAWRVSAQVRAPKLTNGTVALWVQPGPNPESALVTEITQQEHLWQELSVNFVPGEGEVQIAIRVKGDAALAHVDNVTMGPPAITPAPKQVEWLALDESFPIPNKLSVGVEGEDGAVVASAIRLFSETLQEQTGAVVLSQGPLGADESGVELVVAPEDGIEREPESYSLEISRDRVRIVSADERGALYGLMTLLELVQRLPSGESIFLAASIDDAPDLPFRGVYCWGGTYDREVMDRFARLRINAAAFPGHADLFDYCRGLGIEPFPILQCFGHAYDQIAIDPNVVEGTWVVDEKLVLVGTEPVALAHPNVIRTESTDIQITDETGTQTFEEGRDYQVLPGEMEFPFKSDAAPFQVRRTPGSRIPDGATVFASYDYATMGGGSWSYCPNEPRVYPIMRQAIQNLIRTLHPKYLHIGHDEMMQMGTDSRCRKSGRSNAENLAMEVWRLYEMAKAEDPNIRLMMWDDMINPYSHGGGSHSARGGRAAEGYYPERLVLRAW